MCDVTVDNFEELWPTIQATINRASFIGIDSEFTCISGLDKTHNSLFDSMSERYRLQRDNISLSLISQCGVSLFVRASGLNSYVAHTYNFYLCPRAFGSLDKHFLTQASSLQFLRKHKFDFNKFIYDGIPFLNGEEEIMLKEQLADDQFWTNCSRISGDEYYIQEICSSVARWLSDSAEEATEAWHTIVEEPTMRYVLQKELRRRFKHVWTTTRGSEVVVTGVSADVRERMAAADTLDATFTQTLLGFTRVVRHLRDAKRPLVGHNCMLDLMLFHNLFIGALPESYRSFKSTIHQWFPEVYDTKHIVHHVKASCKAPGVKLLSSGSLTELHTGLDSCYGKTAVLFSPGITHAPISSRYAAQMAPHEAGYDSYLAGYCLLRMAHILAHKDVESSEFHRPLNWSEHQAVLRGYRGRVNVIRGSVNHLNLEGADPESLRPRWLHVSCVAHEQLDVGEMAEMFSQYGTVDIRPSSRREALVAAGNHCCARDIVRAFRRDQRYMIVPYSLLRHSHAVRALLWSGVLVCGGLGVCLLFAQLSRRS